MISNRCSENLRVLSAADLSVRNTRLETRDRQTMLLKELSPGTKGTIVGYDKKAPEYRRRLLMLGATPGTAFEVVRVAPLGDPVEIRVRGSFISVRKDEAAIMEVRLD